VFIVYKHGNICIVGLNRRAGYATDHVYLLRCLFISKIRQSPNIVSEPIKNRSCHAPYQPGAYPVRCYMVNGVKRFGEVQVQDISLAIPI
jgi:hypothetical protein